jgi:hypothetical protein
LEFHWEGELLCQAALAHLSGVYLAPYRNSSKQIIFLSMRKGRSQPPNSGDASFSLSSTWLSFNPNFLTIKEKQVPTLLATSEECGQYCYCKTKTRMVPGVVVGAH